MMATSTGLIKYSCDIRQFTAQVQQVTASLEGLAAVIERNRERWYCTSPGDWPDKFALLNRYVRTGIEPTYIFND